MSSKRNSNNPSPGSVQFFFNGRRLSGRAGEPVAKALFNNGIRTLSLSIKYRRPRGISCLRGRCGMCHVEIDGVPGVPSCTTPLREGMRIIREDFKPFYGPAAAAAARLIPLPAGFYYRTLTRPRFINKLFLRFLRSMAGVGRMQYGTDPTRTSFAPAVKAHLKDSYGIIIVGAGISGMAAANAASLEGTDVLVVDEYPQPGGHSFGHQNDERLARQRDQLASKLANDTSITFSPETTACRFLSSRHPSREDGGIYQKGLIPRVHLRRGLQRLHPPVRKQRHARNFRRQGFEGPSRTA